MEETTFIFRVDLGYRLRSRKRVPLHGSREVTDTLSCSCSCLYMLRMLHVPLYMLSDYLAVGPGSAPGVGRGLGYVRDLLKTHTMSSTNQFQ